MPFCRDIPSHEKCDPEDRNISGISRRLKKSRIPGVSQKFGGFFENPGDKNPKIKKNRYFFEIFKRRSWFLGFWDFQDFALGIFWTFLRFSYPDPDPWGFGIFGICHAIPNPEKNPISKPPLLMIVFEF